MTPAGIKRRLLRLIGRGPVEISDHYQLIPPSRVAAESARLADCWKSEHVAASQRAVAESQLARMHAGDVIPAFRVFADAVCATHRRAGGLLEVGCGSGYYSEVLETLCHWSAHGYTGVDYSAELIADARRRYPNCAFEVADAYHLPFADERFAVVVAGGVLLHLGDYNAAIRECARVSSHFVILHRCPVHDKPTAAYRKLGYGVPMIEWITNRYELFETAVECGLTVTKAFSVAEYPHSMLGHPASEITLVCRKR